MHVCMYVCVSMYACRHIHMCRYRETDAEYVYVYIYIYVTALWLGTARLRSWARPRGTFLEAGEVERRVAGDGLVPEIPVVV